MKSNDIIMTFSLLCKNKVVEKPLDHMKNHELEENRMISTPNNMLLNGTYLHANYKIHISMLSVLYTHLVCIEVAGAFSSEYYILLVTYFHLHRQSLHRR